MKGKLFIGMCMCLLSLSLVYADETIITEWTTTGDFVENTGTLNWTSGTEIGESDGSTIGDVSVLLQGLVSDVMLRVRDNDNGGEGVVYEADTSSADELYVSWNWTTTLLDGATDGVNVAVRVGGGTWEYIRNYTSADENPVIIQHQDQINITDYIGTDTELRILSIATNDRKASLFLDQIRLDLVIDEGGDPPAENGTAYNLGGVPSDDIKSFGGITNIKNIGGFSIS